MGELKVTLISNGGSVETDVTYALTGMMNGEVVDDKKFNDFWRRVRLAQEKKWRKEDAENNG